MQTRSFITTSTSRQGRHGIAVACRAFPTDDTTIALLGRVFVVRLGIVMTVTFHCDLCRVIMSLIKYISENTQSAIV